MFENLFFHGRIYIIIKANSYLFLRTLMYCCSWIQLLILYLFTLHDCIYLKDCVNFIFFLSCNSTFTISVRAVASGHSEKAAMPVHLAEVK